MWKIRSHPESNGHWLDFEPVTVLDEYDHPLLFTIESTDGRYFLAYFCGRDDSTLRFLVVPFTPRQEQQLLRGEIDMREALAQSALWAVDLNYQWEPVTCWRLRYDALPPGLLPKPGVMLRASMQPVARNLVSRSITSSTNTTLRFGAAARAIEAVGC